MHQDTFAGLRDFLVNKEEPRITSYNVCYTKLLRDEQRQSCEDFRRRNNVGHEAGETYRRKKGGSSGQGENKNLECTVCEDRITSYNVCYTKLLRLC